MTRLKLYSLLLGSLSALSLNATTIDLGSASSYSVLAASTMTNTGLTVVSRNLGVSQGSSTTGFPPGIVNGTQPTLNLTGQDLSGLTLLPGVYRFDSSAQLTGALNRATNSSVATINGISGPSCCNVSWQGGSSATLGINAVSRGNIFTLTRVTLTTRANIADGGRALALNGAVTRDPNRAFSSTFGDPLDAIDSPEPGTLLLLGAGLFGLVLLGRRTKSRAETAHA